MQKFDSGPKDYVQDLTYVYSRNTYSSRKTETAYRQDINFMSLLAWQNPLDHSTIVRFWSEFLADACKDLFYQMVRVRNRPVDYQRGPYL